MATFLNLTDTKLYSMKLYFDEGSSGGRPHFEWWSHIRFKQFLIYWQIKHVDIAVRCNINQPSVEDIRVKTTLGELVSYRLLSIPVYLTERLAGLIEQAHN